MSRRLRRFRRLRELAHTHERQAAQDVAQAGSVAEREKQRLQRMQQDHVQRSASLNRRDTGERLDMTRESTTRLFLERLEGAMQSQRQAVLHAGQRLQERLRTLRERRTHRRALERFEERILLQEEQEATRREQIDLDEMGINVFRGTAKDVS